MISIKNLTINFSGNVVLQKLSVDFTLNQVYGIIGLNGAGKTTFFNSLSGNLKLDAGEICFMENNISAKDIAFLETVNFFYSRITGNEYLKIFKQSNKNFNLSALQEFLKLPLDDLIETYSTGMKKKLALLGILKQDKSIYLLDEPFNGLDIETNKVLEIIISTLKEKGKTIFLSSHIIDPLLSICDKIYFLESGTFAKSYSKPEFHQIEDELFGKLKSEAKNKLINSI